MPRRVRTFVSTATTKELGVVLDSHNAVARQAFAKSQLLETLSASTAKAQKLVDFQATVSQKQDEEKGMLEAQSLIMISVIPFSSLTRSSMMTTLLL